MEATEVTVKKTKREIERARRERATSMVLRLKDKEDKMKRMERIDAYKREQLKAKIEAENERLAKTKVEKEAQLVSKQELHKQLDMKRTKMIDDFERKKRRWQSSSKERVLARSLLMESNNTAEISLKDQSLGCQSVSGEGQIRTSEKELSRESAMEVISDLRKTLHNELMDTLSTQEQIKCEQEEKLRNVFVADNELRRAMRIGRYWKKYSEWRKRNSPKK
eukprot:TRINITY_DN1528_c0_g1_i7.p2 TRINITY_DN1528_c0_g1~~TRINITY_DN1528_c0_g1_i7.p2  ORF type:complete len:222 (-),score=55.08 TRINITY_DN1528_c0_g1_i7:264-929(-)